ncbi:VOC family protein [Pseudomonas aeruginosa]|nr:VOC family protein [Pseudomonas aeruginosa]
MERAIPTFPCRDLDSASAFYQSLGFHLGARYPTYAILQRGALELHLSLFEALEPKTNCSAAYLRLEDAQALHRQAAALGLGGQGIPRITALEDQPWGMREFALVDPDGNLLRVGQELDATPEQHRVRLASADDVPAVAALWQANVREAGETLDAGDQQAIQALLPGRLAQPLALAGGGPAASPRFRPRPLVADRGRSGTGRMRSQSSTYCRRPVARAWPGNWWAVPKEALRSRGAGLIRAQSALDAPLSNLFWQGLGLGRRLPDLHSLLTWGASSCATSC